MLENVFARLKQEIAIDGFKGTCINEIWNHVKAIATHEIVQREGELSTPMNLDMAYKCYVWRFIRHFQELVFYEKLDKANQTSDQLEDDQDENDTDSSDTGCDGRVKPFCQLKLKDGIPKDFKPIDDIASLEYDKVVEKYGDRLYIIATPEYQKEQLNTGVPPGPAFSQNLVVLLQTIMKSRHKGITQADITRIFDLDPRSTGHYVKSLEKMGAITRTTYSHAGIRTNLCVHTRFTRTAKLSQHDEDEEDEEKTGDNDEKPCPYNVNTLGVVFSAKSLLNSITELLSDAKDNVMFSDDILNALGFNSKKRTVRKWFNRAIDIMCLRGYIQKFVAKENNVGRSLRCLKLLKTELSMKRHHSMLLKEVSKDEDENRVLVVPRVNGRHQVANSPHFYRGSTLEAQIIEALRTAGVQGITQKDIGRAINCTDSRMLYRALERMVSEQRIGVENYGVCRHLEFEGRNRRYRYFTYISYKKAIENEDVLPIKYCNFTPDSSHIQENDYFNYCHNKFTLSKKATKEIPPLLPRQKRPEPGIQREYASVNNPPSFDPTPIVKRAVTLKRSSVISSKPEKIIKRRKQTTKTTKPKQTRGPYKKRKMPQSSDDETSNEYVEPRSNKIGEHNEYQRITRSTKDTQAKKLKTTTLVSTPAKKSTAANGTKDLGQINLSKEVNVVSNSQGIENQIPENILPESVSINSCPQPATVHKNQALPLQTSESLIPQKCGDQLTEHENRHITKKPSATPLAASRTFDRPTTRSTATRQTTLFELFSKRPKEPNPRNHKQSVPNEPSVPLHTNERLTRSIKGNKVSQLPAAPNQRSEQDSGSPSITQAFLELGSVNTEVAKVPRKTQDRTTTNADSLPRITRSARMYGKEHELIRNDDTVLSPINHPSNDSHIVPERKLQEDGKPTAVDKSQDSEEDDEEYDEEEEDEEEEEEEDEEEEKKKKKKEKGKQKKTVNLRSNDKNATAKLKSGSTKRAPRKKHGPAMMNRYMLQRKTVILALLECYPIMERNFHFKGLFEEKTKEMYGDSLLPTSIICIKTIWRAVEELAREDLVYIREITLENICGKKTKRDIMFRRDIDADGELMKDYLKYVGKGEPAWGLCRPQPQFEKIEQPERLSDRIARMEVEHTMAVKGKNITEAAKIQTQLKKFRKNINLANIHPEDPTESADGRENEPSKLLIGLRYGFISSKFIRAKRLHQYLNDLVNRGLSDIDSETRQVPVIKIVQNLTFGEYLKIIGIFFNSAEIQEYFNGPSRNRETILCELPKNIQDILFSRKTRLLRRLRLVLDVLEGLEIIERGIRGTTSLDTYFSSWTVDNTKVCTLRTEVPIRDVLDPDQIILRTYPVCTPADIHIYWSDLQYRCTSQAGKMSEINNFRLKPTRRSFVNGMLYMKNWRTTYQMTSNQKKILEAYIDRVNKTTPLKNIDICNKAAEESGMSLSMVRAHYRKVEVSFHIRQEKLSIRNIERHVYGRKRFRKPRIKQTPMDRNSAKGHSDSLKLSGNIDYLNDETEDQSEHSGLDSTNMLGAKNGGDQYGDDKNLLNFFTDDQFKLFNDKTGRKRYHWSEQEDDLLIYGYVIVSERLKDFRFTWGAIERVFSDRTISSLRNRLKKLHETASAGPQINTLRQLWGDIYTKGRESGAIIENEETIHDTTNFDLLGQVRYFLEQLQKNPSPFTIDNGFTLSTDAGFEKNIVKPEKKRHYEDIYHIQCTPLAKKAVLCYNTPRLRHSSKYVDTICDPALSEMDQDKRIVSFIKVFIMMTLLSPEKTYEPFFAYAILKKFSDDLVSSAVDAFSDEGSIVRNSRYKRRIPGRKEGLSYKFLKFMNGETLNFSAHAARYEEYITKKRDVEFMPLISGKAAMVCILDLFSDGRLRLDIKDKSTIEGPNVMLHSKSRFVDSSHAYFDIKIKLETPREQDVVPKIVDYNENVICLQEDAFENAFDNLYVKDYRLKAIVGHIVEKLSNMGSDGATLLELKKHIKTASSDTMDEDIIKAIDILSGNNPPLVARVGFEAYRFVLPMYLENWLIVPSGVIIPKPADSEKRLIIEELAESRKPVINLRRWNDLNGKRIDRVWRVCLRSIVELVMARPGIFMTEIQQHFKDRFTRTEVEDLLTALVESKALKKLVIYSNTRKVSIFGQPSVFEVQTSQKIDIRTKTCYWTVSGYYNKI
ncbi:hypothetical protein CLU79DRAFT_849605 [Phycomyces nitens]|nr:hypothetical protein CLU79DRAFT_849605 [Phycomyces nitens]